MPPIFLAYASGRDAKETLRRSLYCLEICGIGTRVMNWLTRQDTAIAQKMREQNDFVFRICVCCLSDGKQAGKRYAVARLERVKPIPPSERQERMIPGCLDDSSAPYTQFIKLFLAAEKAARY